MSNDNLMLLFTAGIFLIALLTFALCESSSDKIKILTITFCATYRKNHKKIVAPYPNWKTTILTL